MSWSAPVHYFRLVIKKERLGVDIVKYLKAEKKLAKDKQ
jgi:hypothetical protein